MTLPVVIKVEKVYGELKAYPVSSSAKVFAEIAGTVTLTRKTLRLIKALGIEIQQQSGELIAL